MESTILWGCIADDFTGASDAASFFEKGGLKTVLYNGIPKENTRSFSVRCIEFPHNK